MRVNPLEVSKLLDIKKTPRHTLYDIQHKTYNTAYNTRPITYGIQHKTYYTRHTAQYVQYTVYTKIPTTHNLQHGIQHKTHNIRHTAQDLQYIYHEKYNTILTTRHTAQELQYTTYNIHAQNTLRELFIIRLKTRHTTQTYNMLYTTNTNESYSIQNLQQRTFNIRHTQQNYTNERQNTHEKETHLAY